MAKHRRNKLRVYIQFVWTTEDRLPLVTPDIERDVYRYITVVCQKCGCEMLALGGLPDHVHLYVTLPSTVDYSVLMRNVKGGSSRLINQTLKPDQFFGWNKNYGAFSTRKSDIPIVVEYIENQKQRHAEGKLWPALEESFEEVDDEDQTAE